MRAEKPAALDVVAVAATPPHDGDVAIVVRQTNPKRPGSQSHARYERYKEATTRDEYRALGGSAADFDFDLAHGYVTVHPGAAPI